MTTLFSQLASAFSLGSATSPLDGAAAYSAFENVFQGGAPWINSSIWDPMAPKAYLNYLLFDENFVLVDAGFDQVSTDCEQESDLNPVAPHDYLSLHVKVEQKGYLYVYLSNEQPSLTNVYFDDMKIVQYSAVEQVSDYYPFGLTFNSYQRENSFQQNHLYNGKELQNELDLNWVDYGARMYMPDLGRFSTIDVRAHNYMTYTPYGYVVNNPTNNVDYNGEFILPKNLIGRFKRIAHYLKNDIQGILKNKRIVSALKKYGGFSDQQLKEAFTWGSGPVLHADEFPDQEKFTRFGETLGLLDDNFNYVPGSVNVSINIDLFEELEAAEGKDRDYWLFMTAVTIVHELVHYGEFVNNIKERSKEAGSDFEREAYGKIINTSSGSYKEVLDKWIQRHGLPPLEYFYKAPESNDPPKQRQKKKPDADKRRKKTTG